MLTFRDVIVAPTTAMGWRPEPFELRTGPIWPDFAAQREVRHCRGPDPTPYDTAPEPPVNTVDTLHEAAWCGPWCIHFGYAVADFATRIAESAHRLPGIPLLFTADPRDEPPAFFHAMLALWGVEPSRIRLVRAPLRVATLHVVPQAERMHGPAPSSNYLDLLDRLVAGPRDPDLAGRTVFLSREPTHAASRAGWIAGEGYLAAALAAAGAIVAAPDALSVGEQARLYRGAAHLVFPAGLAVHGLQLVGRVAASVTVLARRPGERVAEHAVRGRSEDAAWPDATAGTVLGLRNDGKPDPATGITVLDAGRLLAALSQATGLGLESHWDARAYDEACLADIRLWVAHRAKARGRHPDPEEDAATVARTAAEVPLLRRVRFDPALPHGRPTADARWLGHLLGLPAEDFALGSVTREHAVRAATALARDLPSHNPVAAPPPREGPERVAHDRIQRRWRGAGVRAEYEARNEAFLSRGPATVPSPLTDREARILGRFPVGGGQATVCDDRGEIILFLAKGPDPIGMVYPRRRRFVALTARGLETMPLLRDTLGAILGDAAPFVSWMRRAMEGTLEPAFVVADNRISHFITDTLSYLHAHEERLVLPFLRDGGRLLIAPDLCAMDPLALFPSLRPFSHAATIVAGPDLTRTVLERGLDAQRAYRARVIAGSDWLRDRITAHRATGALPPMPPEGRHLTVLVSVDAERNRFVNQVEAIGSALRRLAAACVEDGSALRVVWDGWTLSGPPTEGDRRIFRQIEEIIAAILATLDAPPAGEIRIFDRTALDKIPAAETSDLVLVTRGGGSVVPSWLLRRPTVHYRFLDDKHPRSLLDPGAVEVPRAAVTDLSVPRARGGRQERFAVAPWGLEEAMAKALTGRLHLARTILPPHEGGPVGMAVPRAPS